MEQADVRIYQIWLLKITHMEETAIESLGLVEATSSTDKDGQDAGMMASVNETKHYLWQC